MIISLASTSAVPFPAVLVVVLVCCCLQLFDSKCQGLVSSYVLTCVCMNVSACVLLFSLPLFYTHTEKKRERENTAVAAKSAEGYREEKIK